MRIMMRVMLLVVVALSLVACSDDGVKVTAKFSNTQDINEGTRVYFGSKVIGSVNDISKTEHGSVVQMSLDSALSKKVNSRAAVVVNRLRQGAPLELHNPPGRLKESLQDGQTIEALDSMLQLVGWGVTGTVEAGTDSIAEFKEYLNSDEFENEKEQMTQAIDEGLKAATDGIKEAEQALEDVVGEMSLSEEELAAVMAELGDEMAPMVKELAQGGAELMIELERFTESLEHRSETDQKSGEEFLKSLTETLETLNQSFEEGIAEGLNQDPSLESESK